MSQNGQTHFKNLAVNAASFLKTCLTLLKHALKGKNIKEKSCWVLQEVKIISFQMFLIATKVATGIVP